ncbi:YlxR family protein [Kocuria sp. M1R5S2]|uniref:YlxR family protein n=1 Tax=Kocuria rhizosphaerae TaxID=3376285 RepID=UPI003790453D
MRGSGPRPFPGSSAPPVSAQGGPRDRLDSGQTVGGPRPEPVPGPHGPFPTSRRETRSATRVSADSRRTCIGCRTTEHPDQLVRVATETTGDGPRAVVDRTGRLGGRGAWLHLSRECLDTALRRRAFGRAFRGPVDTGTVAAELEALLSSRTARRPAERVPTTAVPGRQPARSGGTGDHVPARVRTGKRVREPMENR